MNLPHGVWPVALTPFHDDGSLDLDGLDALVDWYLAAGVAGIFAICQSSEMTALTSDEKLRIVERMQHRINGRIPIVAAGLDQQTLDARLDHARALYDLGVSAVVILTNTLTREADSEETWWQAITPFMDASDTIPLGLYECPRPYQRLLSADMVTRCAESGRFVFMKETSCDLTALAAKLHACSESQLQIYPAHGPSILHALHQGSAGACNIAANVVPELYAWLCRNGKSDQDTAAELQSFLSIIDANIGLGYPASAKRWLSDLGLDLGDRCRERQTPLRADDEGLRRSAMARAVAHWHQRLQLEALPSLRSADRYAAGEHPSD